MIETTYISKEGKQRSNYKLESTDSFIFKELRSFDGKFGKRYFVVTEEDKWIQLTGGQYSFFERYTVHPGTEIKCENYSNDYGTFVGLRFANQEKNVDTKPQSGLPSLAEKNDGTLLSEDEETCLNQLLGQPNFLPWKNHAKKSAENFKESLMGVAEKCGIKIDVDNRKDMLYKFFLTKT